MKNILIISPTGGYAGIDVCIDTLVSGINKKKYALTVVFPLNSILMPKFENEGIKCYELPLNWWFPVGFSGNDLLQVIPTLREKVDPLIHIIKDNNIDIVLSNTSVFFDGALAAAISGIPHIFYVHAQYVNNIYADMLQETKDFLYMLMGKLSYRVVCCSSKLHDFMSQYIDNSMYIFNGVDTDKFHYTKKVLSKCDKLNMVCVGHYNSNKQQEFILKSLVELKNMRPEIMQRLSFTMIGPGEANYQNKLKDIVKINNLDSYVNFEGFRDDIYNYLEGFNLYINSSVTENLPVSVLEAMSCGLPVLGTPNDGTTQLIQEGETGYIVDNPKMMAKKIIDFIDYPDTLERMSVNGRIRVERYFSNDQYITEFERLFDQIDHTCIEHNKFPKYVNGLYESIVGRSLSKYPFQKVLVIYPQQAMATYFIAAKNPLDYLKEMNLVDYKSVTLQEFKRQDLNNYDIVYCLRCFDDFAYSILIQAKDRNIPFIWYIDDNYSALKIHNDEVVHTQYSNSLYERMYAQSSAVVVNSGELYYFGKQFTDHIFRLPTYQISNKLLVKEVTSNDKIVTIGFMGTLMRDGDFAFVVPALEGLIEEYGDRVNIEFIGYSPAQLKGYTQVRSFDFIDDYNEFRRFFASRKWNIGLAPLNDTEFNRSKTNNKYREYSSFRIAGIYSNMSAYNYCIQNGVNGFLAENTKEDWYHTIKKLIDNSELRFSIAENAWQDVEKNYSIEKFSKGLMDVFCRQKCDLQQTVLHSDDNRYKIVLPRQYNPDLLCFSKSFHHHRKYKVYCEAPVVRQIGILFAQEKPSKGTVTLVIYDKKHMLRTATKNISEFNFNSWNYFDVEDIYCAVGRLLTVDIITTNVNGAIGVFEDSSRRTFWYKVFNKLRLPLKGMDTLMVDFQS